MWKKIFIHFIYESLYSEPCRHSKYCISHNILVFSFPTFSSINIWNIISILRDILWKNVSVNCLQMWRWTVSNFVGELSPKYVSWTVLSVNCLRTTKSTHSGWFGKWILSKSEKHMWKSKLLQNILICLNNYKY